MIRKPRAMGLFDGIGGGLLAAKRAGCEIVASCEINRFCQEVLKARFPEAKHYGDILTADFSPYHGNIDVLLAGFPCQPYSTAGLRKGSLDDRALWPVTCRVLDAVRPRVAVLENVAGLLTILQPDRVSEVEEEALPLFRDGDHNGFSHTTRRVRRRVLADILGDLDAIGYDVPRTADGTPVVLRVPAAAVGACHRRDRVGIVAYARFKYGTNRLYGVEPARQAGEYGDIPADADPVEVASILCSVDDGVPAGLDGSASRSAWRSESLKGYGNAWHVGLWEVIVRAAIEALNQDEQEL